jgi:hypothetical protein
VELDVGDHLGLHRERDGRVSLNVEPSSRLVLLTLIHIGRLPLNTITHSKRFYTLMEVKDQPEEERLTAEEFNALRQLEPVLKVSLLEHLNVYKSSR